MAQAPNDNRNRDKRDRGAKNQESDNNEIAQLNTPPHSMEAEQAVLGSIMQSVDAWDKIAEILIQEDFYNRAHRLVFAAITRLIAKNSAADPITLKDELESNNELEDVGGFTYIVNLARNTPSSSNITAYANIVRERAIVRELIGAANEIADASFNPEGRDSKELLDLAETKVFEIAEKRTAANEGPISVSGALRKTIARIEELAGQDKDVTGVSTGFSDLDAKTSGMQPSDLIIVAARPSMGKCIVSGSQLVDPDSGKLVSIDELVATQSASLTSLNNAFKFEKTQASAFIDDGMKPVFKVRTALGKEIQSTLSHPFLTADGWQPLADIKPGEQIAVPRVLPIFGKDKLIDDEVKAIAYALVDRYLIDNTNIQDTHERFDADSICLLHRPVNALIANEAQQAYVSSFECSDVFETFFEEHLTQIDNKRLPDIIFSLIKPQIALLLNRIFSCDAQFFVGDSETENASVRLRYNTYSKTLAEQIQHLLLRFGILAKLSETSLVGSSPKYSLSLLSNQDALIYLNEIGLYGKDKEVQGAKALLHKHLRPCPSDVLPNSVVTYINQLKGQRTWQQCLHDDSRFAALNLDKLAHAVTRTQALILADIFEDNYLRQLAQSDLYWDTVVSIEAQGDKQVYDLTVPDLHNFIAQDMCVHNTTFAMNLVENALLLEEKPVLVFSLEMPAEQIMMRMLASLSRVNQTSVRTARLEDADWARIQSSVKMLNDKDNLFIDDSSGLTPMEVRTRARKLARDRGGISMIMVDYLQLMRVPSLSENRTLEIAEISRSLKSLAKELECPVIALSQLNRGLEQRADKRPINSDLRESGSIEQDADLIMFIYRDEVYHENSDLKGIAEIIIGKQRNGPIGTTRLTFQGQFSRFDNYAGPAYDEE